MAGAIEAIYENPRAGEVYNLGSGRRNSCSILEAFEKDGGLMGWLPVHEIGADTVEHGLMMNRIAGIRMERYASFRATHTEVLVYPDPER